MRSYLDFEKPVAELEAKIEELRASGRGRLCCHRRRDLPHRRQSGAGAQGTLRRADTLAEDPGRPPSAAAALPRLHHQAHRRFVPLAGDRKYAEDAAIVGGFGRFRGDSVCIIGHEKGSDTDSRLRHNFGMARPEGYRKAARLMDMADRFEIPVIALIDTAGAYPGIGAEERGQAEAIARSTEACLQLGVPNVAAIIGEGGSGGAIADGDRQPRDDARARDLQRDIA